MKIWVELGVHIGVEVLLRQESKKGGGSKESDRYTVCSPESFGPNFSSQASRLSPPLSLKTSLAA